MEKIKTTIWQEDPEPDNHYATQKAYCHGYNVYDDMLGNCRWVEMLFLLFRGEAPTKSQADLLEDLAVAIANPGPRDASVHAAMCGGVGKSVAASSLMAALAVGAGQSTGAREVFHIMQRWLSCDEKTPEQWPSVLTAQPQSSTASTWPETEHTPGFDPYSTTTASSLLTILGKLCRHKNTSIKLLWLKEHIQNLTDLSQQPVSLPLIIATALSDLGFSPEEGEMLTLLLRLPGAAAHSLEQKKLGHKKFPFYALEFNEAQTSKP